MNVRKDKFILDIEMKRFGRWVLLLAASVAVTVPLTLAGVPSAALFAALVVGIAWPCVRSRRQAYPPPRRHGGPRCARRLHRHHGVRGCRRTLGPHWLPVLGVALVTLMLSVLAGACSVCTVTSPPR